MSNVAVHLLVQDEEKLLPQLFAALKGWEIVAVDTGSTDNTLMLLRSRPSTVVLQYPLDGDFSEARNFGLDNMYTAWMFQVDADELPTPSLLQWIRAFLTGPEAQEFDAIEMRRENLVDGEDIGDSTYEWHPRLFRWHLRFVGALHEQLQLDGALLGDCPAQHLLLHHKTSARQERQNEFYQAWPQEEEQ